MTGNEAEQSVWIEQRSRRRRWGAIAAAFVFSLCTGWAMYQWFSLPTAIRSGQYGAGVWVVLIRGDSHQRANVFFASKRVSEGIFAWEDLSMSIQPYTPDGSGIYTPFQIETGDVIALVQEPDPELRHVVASLRSWQDESTPVRSLIGSHSVSATTLRGAETLRPAVWLILIVSGTLATVAAAASAARVSAKLSRFRKGLCPRCRYPLVGDQQGLRCTECGIFALHGSDGVSASDLQV